MSDKQKEVLSQFVQGILAKHQNAQMVFIDDKTKPNLWVYQSNYLYGHIDKLANVFSVTLKVVGNDNFKFFAKSYLEQNPPKSPNMDDFGDHFPVFLEKQPEIKDVPFLHYLAQIDWFLFADSFNPEKFIQLPTGTLRLWNAIKNGQPIDDIVINENEYEKIQFIEG